jgi:hypothetical protein
MAFPHKFYTPYEKGKYSLCFQCHKEALVTVEETRTVTSFRNGEKKLHAFHVKQKKGRTCRACHCMPGCHKKRGYDREKMIINKK